MLRNKRMKLISRITIALILSLSAISLFYSTGSSAAPANWPQWRGPGGSGIFTEKNLPTEWSATRNIKWKAAIAGRGHSSPVVWGNRIFLTTAIEGEAVPGAKAVKHLLDNQEFVHPDSVGADH